ncbi:uncharacterized protein LOC128963254 [Oppia nitens]|uniref:uncharacterized protein LOC128963254 n=1 Tax=Oppia nitens TaxID=1686743 RepID=UPI0023DC08B9|nr:uncharacterized protein LOC128963254 [Oppia nitens]
MSDIESVLAEDSLDSDDEEYDGRCKVDGYYCGSCDYRTVDQSIYDKHLEVNDHLKGRIRPYKPKPKEAKPMTVTLGTKSRPKRAKSGTIDDKLASMPTTIYRRHRKSGRQSVKPLLYVPDITIKSYAKPLTTYLCRNCNYITIDKQVFDEHLTDNDHQPMPTTTITPVLDDSNDETINETKVESNKKSDKSSNKTKNKTQNNNKKVDNRREKSNTKTRYGLRRQTKGRK